MSKWNNISIALALALVVFGSIVLIAGGPPVKVLGILLTGGGTWYGVGEAMVKAIPILMCALAVAIPGRMGLTNIGGEGQFLLGAIGAGAIAVIFPSLPRIVMLPLMAINAALFGMAWGLIPGALRSATRTDETVISLLLNYVAGLLLLHLVNGVLKDPSGMGWPQSVSFGPNARLSGIMGTRLHGVIILAAGAASILAWVWRATVWGFAARVIGANPVLARHMRIPVLRYYVAGFMLAGALAGIAGFGEVSAIHGRLREGISLGYGYAGFFVSWLCGHRFLLCIPAAFAYALVITGADSLQIETGLPFATIYVFQGVLFLACLAIQRQSTLTHSSQI